MWMLHGFAIKHFDFSMNKKWFLRGLFHENDSFP
jgi:hypothetical protein